LGRGLSFGRRLSHDAAAREFVRRGLTRTRERTGVLIYVAAAEHYAEILADIGIADRVDERVWRETIADLVDAIKAGHAADGLLAAIERVGAVLAEHAPARADDIDEFPNKVIVL
jgi:putative membrane protein